MINAKSLLGFPTSFQSICNIYPPKVKDVVGNPKFNVYTTILCLEQEDLEEEYQSYLDNGQIERCPTPFEYLLIFAHQSEENKIICEEAFKLFVQDEVTFLWDAASILIGDLEEALANVKDFSELRLINEENYFEFQNAIRVSMGQEPAESPEDLEQLDPRVQRFKRLQKQRDRVKRKQSSKDAPNLGACLASICCMGIGLNPLNIGEISYASVNSLISTFQKKEKYDSDCTSLLLGADAEKIGFKYWINND